MWGTPYLGLPDETYPPHHPRRREARSLTWVIAYDQMPASSSLRQLYEWAPLTAFMADVLDIHPLHPFGDPMGALNLAVMEQDHTQGWHYDNTDFVVSLALQSSIAGGEFECAARIRSDDDEHYDEVEAVLDGHVPDPRRRVPDGARHAHDLPRPPLGPPGVARAGRHASDRRAHGLGPPTRHRQRPPLQAGALRPHRAAGRAEVSAPDDHPTTQIGEAFVGSGPNAAHLNTVLGARGGPVETAWATSLATPTSGHARFVVVLQPGLPVKPMTLFVPKAEVQPGAHATMTWGPAQAGVAGGVADAVAAGVIDRSRVDDLLLIAAVWVDPDADDAQLVYRNNRQATADALAAAIAGAPSIDQVLAARAKPVNPFFPGPPD